MSVHVRLFLDIRLPQAGDGICATLDCWLPMPPHAGLMLNLPSGEYTVEAVVLNMRDPKPDVPDIHVTLDQQVTDEPREFVVKQYREHGWAIE